jgi:hypothetical protein
MSTDQVQRRGEVQVLLLAPLKNLGKGVSPSLR